MQLQKYLPIILLLLVSTLMEAQSRFKYQAVVRDVEGEVLKETELDVRISIHTEFGELVFSEVHENEITSAFGIIGLNVGGGTLEPGLEIVGMDEIDWSSDFYSLTVDLRIDGANDDDWQTYGTSPILSVPIAMHALSVSDKDDADADPENEIQNLSLVDNVLSISDGNSITLESAKDEQVLSLAGTNLSISGGNSINLAPVINQGGDPSSTNEIQTLTLNGNTLSISGEGGNAVDLPLQDEPQTLELQGNELSISGGNAVTLNTIVSENQTDEIQQLRIDGNELTITNGNTVIIPTGGTDADADPTNEIQNLRFDVATNELSLTDGNTVTIPSGGSDADADPTNEIQTISFDPSTNELSLTDGGAVTIPTGGTDADADPTNEIQNLRFDASTNELSLTDGNTVTIPSGGSDADADPTNEIQTISFDASTNELSLTDGGVVTIPSGGTDADADPTNEIQNLSFDVATNELSLTDGNTVTIPIGGSDADADPTNEIQTISFDPLTNELSLTDGGVVTIPSGGTDADADPTNEIQNLSFDVATNELSLTDGNTVTIPSGGSDADADPTNEIQTISFDASTNELSLTDGGVVTIPTGGTDADADPTNEIQNLRFDVATNELSLTDGNTVVLQTGGSSQWIGNTDIHYDTGNVGIGTSTPGFIQGPSKYLTVSGDGTDGNYASIEIVGRQQTLNRPIGRLDFLSQSGSTEAFGIARVEARVSDGALFRGDLGFSTLTGTSTSSTTLTEHMTIKSGGNVGIGTLSPTAKLDVEGVIQSSHLEGVGQRNVVADERGNLVIGSGGGGQTQDLLFNDTSFELGLTGSTNTIDLSALRSGGETQELLFNDTSYELGITGSSNTIDLSSLAREADADADPFNELQWLTYESGVLAINDFTGSSQSVRINSSNSSSLWSENGSNINYNSGNVGIGTTSPQTTLDVLGGQWDLDNTQGDFRIGNDQRGLRIGVAVGDGPGGGNVRMRAQGGTTNGLILGSGNNDVLRVQDQNVTVFGQMTIPSLGDTETRNLLVDAQGNLTTRSTELKTLTIGANQIAGEDAIYEFFDVKLPESGWLYAYVDIPSIVAIEKYEIYYHSQTGNREEMRVNFAYYDNGFGTRWDGGSTTFLTDNTRVFTNEINSPRLDFGEGFFHFAIFSDDWDDQGIYRVKIYYR